MDTAKDAAALDITEDVRLGISKLSPKEELLVAELAVIVVNIAPLPRLYVDLLAQPFTQKMLLTKFLMARKWTVKDAEVLHYLFPAQDDLISLRRCSARLRRIGSGEGFAIWASIYFQN